MYEDEAYYADSDVNISDASMDSQYEHDSGHVSGQGEQTAIDSE